MLYKKETPSPFGAGLKRVNGLAIRAEPRVFCELFYDWGKTSCLATDFPVLKPALVVKFVDAVVYTSFPCLNPVCHQSEREDDGHRYRQPIRPKGKYRQERAYSDE